MNADVLLPDSSHLGSATVRGGQFALHFVTGSKTGFLSCLSTNAGREAKDVTVKNVRLYLSRRWRLSRKIRETRVNARPCRRLRGPYSRGRLSHFRIIQCPGAYKNQMWPGFGFAEELCTADAAKPPMHPAAAIGDGLIIGEFTCDGDRFGWKASIDGPAAGSEVLAETAPTDPCDNGRSRDLITNGSAQTSSTDQHWSVTSKLRRRSVC